MILAQIAPPRRPKWFEPTFGGFGSSWSVVTQAVAPSGSGTGSIAESHDVVSGSGASGGAATGSLDVFDTGYFGAGDQIWRIAPVYVPRNALALYPFRQITATPGLGAGTILEPSDTVAGVGVGSNTGVGAATESPDVASGSGSGAQTGAGAAQEAADTVTGAGAGFGSGAGALQEGQDVSAGAGSAVSTGQLVSDPSLIVYQSLRTFTVETT